jgi:hypothetical protein
MPIFWLAKTARGPPPPPYTNKGFWVSAATGAWVYTYEEVGGRERGGGGGGRGGRNKLGVGRERQRKGIGWFQRGGIIIIMNLFKSKY